MIERINKIKAKIEMSEQDEKAGSEEGQAVSAPAVPDEMRNIKPKSTSRGWWIKTAFLLVFVVVSIVMLFTLGNLITGEETKQLTFGELLTTINYPYFILFLAVVLFYYFAASTKYAFLLKGYTGKFHLKTSIKTMFLGKYYDGITPLGSGGQPFQIYYLHKKDIPHGVATAVPIVGYFANTIVLLTLAAVLMGMSSMCGLPSGTVTTTIRIIAWISLGLNALLVVAIALFSIFPTPCKRIIVNIVKLLAKMHIVKRKYTVTQKYVREMSEYSTAMKLIFKKFFKFAPLFLLCLLEDVAYTTLPFFIVIAFVDVAPTLELVLQISCLVMISRYSAILIPTPGNSLAVETTASFVFITVTGIEPVLGWVILAWRFVTFYLYLLSGIGINIFEIVRSAVRNKRAAKNLQTK